MSRFLSKFAGILLLFIISACANHVNPTGGPKDTLPPYFVATSPADSTINFRGKKLSFTFDDFVELKNAGTGILISPPMNAPIKAILRGKKLELTLGEEPDSNTTYTLTIGKSIVDLSEGNPLVETGFVFSTGPFLDSLTLSGSVKDAITNKPVKDALVLLYTGFADSLPVKTLPRYFARTNETGNYRFENLHDGKYMAFALVDGNTNFKFDTPDEKIGFQNQPVQLDTISNQLPPFRIFVSPSGTLRLQKKKFELPGKLTLKYGVKLDEWSLENLDSSDGKRIYYSDFKAGKDSVIAWIPSISGDSVSLISTASKGVEVRTDTLIFDLQRLRNVRSIKISKTPVDTVLKVENNLQSGKLRAGEALILRFSRPVTRIDTLLLKVIVGLDTLPLPFSESPFDLVFYSLRVKPGATTNYTFFAFPGAFVDVFGRKNDTLKTKVELFSEDDLGSVAVKLETDSMEADSAASPLILELVGKDGKVLRSVVCEPDKEVLFSGLLPDEYNLRLIVDENRNGKWDSGSYSEKKQPERYLYCPDVVKIRAGWDLEQRWEVDLTGKTKN